MKVEVKERILGKNDAIAERLRSVFAENGIFVVNLLSSPGAGKTTLLESTLKALSETFRIGVIEGDLFTSKDAERIHAAGVPVYQINTVGGCHLDANMVAEAVTHFDLAALDLIIIENVGNLVCPAEFDIGETVKVVLLSVTEGEDKPLKYPLVFKESAAVVLTKTDLLPYLPFDKATAVADIRSLNPSIRVLEASSLTGEGLSDWTCWLTDEIRRRIEAREEISE